jgi:spermidine synthase
MSLNPAEWFTEAYEGRTAFSVRYSKKLFDSRSEFQKVEIFETEAMGRVLILEGCFMVTDKDSFVYHEMLVHPAMACLDNPKKVVVIGGGDGGAVTEIVKYPSVESVVLCEIDPMVISSCREYFPEISAGLSDPRVEIVTRDGAAFIAEHPGEFDLVLVDSTDPVGPGEALYRISFYEAIKRSLKPGGATVLQTESPLFMQEVFSQSVAKLRGVFGPSSATPFLAVIPSYPGALWSFTFCSESLDPKAPKGLGGAPAGLKYYSPEIHAAAFTLPPFVAKLQEG